MLGRTKNEAFSEIASLPRGSIRHLKAVVIDKVAREERHIGPGVQVAYLGMNDRVNSQQEGQNVVLTGEEFGIPIVDSTQSLVSNVPDYRCWRCVYTIRNAGSDGQQVRIWVRPQRRVGTENAGFVYDVIPRVNTLFGNDHRLNNVEDDPFHKGDPFIGGSPANDQTDHEVQIDQLAWSAIHPSVQHGSA